jgi:hypothetical protein
MSAQEKLSVEDRMTEELRLKLEARKAKGWKGPVNAINLDGRPKREFPDKPKTNREVREQELLSLTRKLKPHLTKAVLETVKILDNSHSSDQNKLKAAAFLVGTYKDLIKETFDYRYDTEAAEEVQQQNAPVFSLRMIDDVEPKEEKQG